MKTATTRADRGSALLLALIAFVIVAGAGAAVFSFTMSGHKTTFNASNADLAYHVAEAGIDDTLNKLAGYAASPDLKYADFAVIGYAQKHDGMLVNLIQGSVNRGDFLAAIDPPYAGLGTYRVRSIGTYSGERRAIETYVMAVNQPGSFQYGLFGDVTVDSGGSLITDGYKSSMGNYASLGKKTHTDGKTQYVNDTGHLGSNGDIDVGGSAKIFGNATPGATQPDGTTHSVTGGGYIAGSKAPAPVPYPLSAVDYSPTVPVIKTLPSSSLAGGEYHLDSLSLGSKDTLTITGDVTIYVDGDINITAQAQVFINDGAKLTIRQNSGSLAVHGGAEVNTNGGIGVGSGKAADFQIWSKASDVTVNGGAGYIGAIYAPEADIKLNGNAEFFGSMVGKTIKPTGNAYFHYDEDLGAVSVPKIVFQVKTSRQYIP